MPIYSTGYVLPVLISIEMAVYLDRSPEPFGWKPWIYAEDRTATLGLDLGRVRLRLVLQRLNGANPAESGWV